MWNDEWFYDLSPNQKLVWVFLLTNPRNNIAGVYQMNPRWAAGLIGISADEYSLCIAYFEESKKIIKHGDWIILVNFSRHQSNNPKVEAGVLRILGELPKEVAQLLPWDSLCIAYRTLLNSTLLNLNRQTKRLDFSPPDTSLLPWGWWGSSLNCGPCFVLLNW